MWHSSGVHDLPSLLALVYSMQSSHVPFETNFCISEHSSWTHTTPDYLLYGSHIIYEDASYAAPCCYFADFSFCIDCIDERTIMVPHAANSMIIIIIPIMQHAILHFPIDFSICIVEGFRLLAYSAFYPPEAKSNAAYISKFDLTISTSLLISLICFST